MLAKTSDCHQAYGHSHLTKHQTTTCTNAQWFTVTPPAMWSCQRWRAVLHGHFELQLTWGKFVKIDCAFTQWEVLQLFPGSNSPCPGLLPWSQKLQFPKTCVTCKHWAKKMLGTVAFSTCSVGLFHMLCLGSLFHPAAGPTFPCLPLASIFSITMFSC